MKKTFMALAFGLASISAFADDGIGEVRFIGSIKDGGTCPIDVTPVGSTTPGTVFLGSNIRPTDFKAIGDATTPVNFRLKIDDSGACDLTGGGKTVKFTFTAQNGVEGATGNLFGIQKAIGAAENIAVGITDRNGVSVISGAPTAAYTISPSEKAFDFSARLVATDATVKPGPLVSEVGITAEIK